VPKKIEEDLKIKKWVEDGLYDIA